MRNLSILLCGGIACAMCASAQGSADIAAETGLSLTTPVVGHPLSADGETQTIRRLPDDNRITGPKTAWKFYRDAQGRTRREESRSGSHIEITDPVAHVRYTIFPDRKTFQSAPWNPGSRAPHVSRGEDMQPPQALGTRTIEGLLCDGVSTATVWPAGSRNNDQPFTVTTEVWKARELDLSILIKVASPLSGDHTQRLFNIVPGDPPADLFQPPASYQPQNQSGFTARSFSSLVFGAGPISPNTVVTGIPLSADIEFAPNGASLGQPVVSKFYRDAQGRTRRDSPSGTTFEIFDPVSQSRYLVYPARKTVRQFLWHPLHGPITAPDGSKSLGTKSIEGFLCEGSLIPLAPSSRPQTNPQLTNLVAEIWTSKELQLNLEAKIPSAATMGQSGRLTNIKRGDPPADLFQPPPGYTMADGDRTPGDVSGPVLLTQAYPEYSEKARKAKLKGTVLLRIVVGVDGVPRDIEVLRPLGMGLDEKAIECVSKWRFKPGMKDGEAVPVASQVEVVFRLL